MALVEAFYRLLVAADLSVARTKDRKLERVIEAAWQDAQPSLVGVSLGRCTVGLHASGLRLRCIHPKRHEGDCVFLLEVRQGSEGLTFRKAYPRHYSHRQADRNSK